MGERTTLNVKKSSYAEGHERRKQKKFSPFIAMARPWSPRRMPETTALPSRPRWPVRITLGILNSEGLDTFLNGTSTDQRTYLGCQRICSPATGRHVRLQYLGRGGASGGNFFDYPIRPQHDSKSSPAGYAAPPAIAVQGFNRLVIPAMRAKLRSGLTIKHGTRRANRELEEFATDRTTRNIVRSHRGVVGQAPGRIRREGAGQRCPTPVLSGGLRVLTCICTVRGLRP